MKNNLASKALFFICAGLSVNVCAMQQRRDCNMSIKKLTKVARVENEAKRALAQIKVMDDSIKNMFRDKKRADAVRQDQYAACPTLCAKNNKNTFMRLNALKNANYFSPREFERLNEKVCEQFYEIDLSSISQTESDLFEEKCNLLKDAIKKGMKAGHIQNTEPDLGPLANTLRREIIGGKDGGVE